MNSFANKLYFIYDYSSLGLEVVCNLCPSGRPTSSARDTLGVLGIAAVDPPHHGPAEEKGVERNERDVAAAILSENKAQCRQ